MSLASNFGSLKSALAKNAKWVLSRRQSQIDNVTHITNVASVIETPPDVNISSIATDILTIGYQPFIHIYLEDDKQTWFMTCNTQNDVAGFVHDFENSDAYKISPLLKGLSTALRGDFLGASERFLEWIEFGSPVYEGAIHLEEYEHGVGYRLEFPTFVVRNNIQQPHPTLSTTPELRAEHLHRAARLYNLTTGNDLYRCYLLEGMTLGLSRYYSSIGSHAEASDILQVGLRLNPKSLHLKAAKRAVELNSAGEQIPFQLRKFLGRDKGEMKGHYCTEPFQRFDISPTGEVLLCCGHWLPTPVGNLMNQDARDIMNSPKAQEIRASVLDGSFRYCNHLECMLMVQDRLPKKEDASDPELRKAIDTGKMDVEGISRLLFAFDQSCNLSCPSCRTKLIVEKASQSEEKAIVVRDKLVPLLAGLRELEINPAGEAFFSKPTRKILSLIDRESCPDLKVNIISNGTLLTEVEWAKFPNLKGMVHSIRISTDGASKETFEKLRRLGNWQQFRKNLDFLSELRRSGEIEDLRFSFTYQLDNFHEMGDFARLVKSLGGDYVIFERLQNLGAFTWKEFEDKAVHAASHPRHVEFLDALKDPILREAFVLSDFEWGSLAAIADNERRKRVEPNDRLVQFVGA